MDMIKITCPRCGYTEGFAHPDSVRERKECPGCLAEEMIRGGLLYSAMELSRAPSDTTFSRSSTNHGGGKDGKTKTKKDIPGWLGTGHDLG